MVNKKRKHPTIEQVLERPWCYYCERDFDDLKILISHQKAKHYKCDTCNRRLNTAGGLSVHLQQVHKSQLQKVDNALGNRANPDLEIFGMEGIPQDVLDAHNQRVTQEYYANEAAHRAATGNFAPVNTSGGGNQQGNAGVKKIKTESADDLKKRLAEHKAKMAAKKAAEVSGSNTPTSQVATPQPSQFPTVFPPLQGTPPQAGFPAPYSQPAPFVQQHSPFDPQFGGHQGPYTAPGPFPIQQQFGHHNGAPGFPPGPYNQFGGPPPGAMPPAPNHFPPQPFNHHTQPPQSASPIGGPAMTAPQQRQNHLPTAPGLPQRPSFNAPPAAKTSPPPAEPVNAISSSVDDLISSAQQTPRTAAPAPSATPAVESPKTPKPAETNGTPKAAAPVASEAGQSKKAKKTQRLVYSDDQMSPEEKMAGMSRYSFRPKRQNEVILGPVEASVTGTVRGSDDVMDKQG